MCSVVCVMWCDGGGGGAERFGGRGVVKVCLFHNQKSKNARLLNFIYSFYVNFEI